MELLFVLVMYLGPCRGHACKNTAVLIPARLLHGIPVDGVGYMITDRLLLTSRVCDTHWSCRRIPFSSTSLLVCVRTLSPVSCFPFREHR